MSGALTADGAGFIGSHLTEGLLERGWTVEAVNDLSARQRDAHLSGEGQKV
jgi:nucleoside-diphosphate-sugar epimerase